LLVVLKQNINSDSVRWWSTKLLLTPSSVWDCYNVPEGGNDFASLSICVPSVNNIM